MAQRFWKCDRCGEMQSGNKDTWRVTIKKHDLFNAFDPSAGIAVTPVTDLCEKCHEAVREVLRPLVRKAEAR